MNTGVEAVETAITMRRWLQVKVMVENQAKVVVFFL
jgi:acetylornithine/succinyldiaminopimelate/putrescine aminotransferase